MDAISFARGNPTPEILPVAELADCARAVVERDGSVILNYGAGGGYAPLREWIASRHGVSPAQVIVTPSSLLAFRFVMRQLVGDGACVAVEAPSYDRTILVLRELGARVVGVPMDDDGIELDRVEELLAGDDPPRALYTIPTFQNPSGRTLSLERRRGLVELARTHGLLLFEDDPYGLVRFEGEPLPSLYELADGDGVVYASSFSKTVAPGLRVGYVVVPAELAAPVEKIANATYISPPLLPQAAIRELIRRGGFEPNLERARELLRLRRDAMVGALAAEMPVGSSWNRPQGGYFLWLDFPVGVLTDDVFDRAAEAGVAFVKGSDFFPGPGGESSARLAFSFPSVDEIHEGVRRLATVVRTTVPLTT
ncbi:MAG: PLP-dependent aminotransferase family protein [Thermoleophilia bacterium]|nr:PLP-dependent aminotransferase family protein [Thermoleophilia bacterium]